MSLYLSGALLVVGAGLLLLASLAFMLRGKWLLRWLQGTAGIFALLVAMALLLLAANLFSFHSLTWDKDLASLRFESLADQRFLVTILEHGEEIKELELLGDLWQIDARVIKWQGWVSALGIMPGYQLGRIQGRYLSIEQERTAPRSVHSLGPEGGVTSGFSLGRFHSQSKAWMPWVDARYGSATFLPMTDGAEFSLSLSHTGLLARPLNSAAQEAVSSWSY